VTLNLESLAGLTTTAGFPAVGDGAQVRLGNLPALTSLAGLETLTAWSDEMLRLDTETLTQVLRLGARIKRLIGRTPVEDGRSGGSGAVTPAHLLGP